MSQTTALALTWLIELGVAVALSGRRDARLIVVVVTASLLTHPVVWWVGQTAGPEAWWPRILFVEAVVAVAEGAFVRVAAREPRGLAVGVAMNVASFAIGLVISPFL